MKFTGLRQGIALAAIAGVFPASGCTGVLGISDVPPATDTSIDGGGTADAHKGADATKGGDARTDSGGTADATPDRTSPRDSATGSDGAVGHDAQPLLDAAGSDANVDSGCAAATTACGAAGCVDLTTDVQHCGACNVNCTTLPNITSGASCTAGRCVYTCATGYDDCASTGAGCPDSLSAATSCGSCGVQCAAPNPVCLAGACAPSCGGTKPDLCSGSCTNKSNDPANCGVCGTKCDVGGVCTAGTCSCPGSDPDICTVGTVTSCVNKKTDNNNCGACGNTCSAGGGETCVSGVCVCGVGTDIDCSHTCVNPKADVNNCGGCGTKCNTVGGEGCGATGCTCTNAALTDCAGTCVDTTSDNNHCGTCANTCNTAGGESCIARSCVCPTGSGETDCSGTCTTMLTDVNNCGGCGKTCTGTCTNGTCLATLDSGRNPYALALDSSSNVYWTNQTAGNYAVLKMTAGGVLSTIATPPDVPWNVATDGTTVYWTSDVSAGTVRKVPAVGPPGSAALVAGSQAYPAGITVDASGNVYWVTNGTVQELKNATATAFTFASFSGYGQRIVTSGTTAYWTEFSSDVYLCALGGTCPTAPTITASAAEPFAIAVDTTYVYWTTQATASPFTNGSIYRASLTGSGVTALLQNVGNPHGIVSDGSHLYWTDQTGRTIVRSTVSGGSITTLATGQQGPETIAIDSTSVYWTTAGTVMKLTPR